MPNIGGVQYPYTAEGLADAQQTGQLSYSDLLAQVSALDPNWQYNDQLVTLMDNAFRQQFAAQQPAVAPISSPPLTGTQGTLNIPSATAGLDSARQPHTGVPGIPTATPGVGGGRTQSTVYQPRDSRDYRAIQQPITRQPGMQQPIMQQAGMQQAGMMTQRQPQRSYREAPLQPLSSRMPNTGQMNSSYGGQRPTGMPNTGQQTYSGYSQRPTGTPVAGQQQAQAAQSKSMMPLARHQQMYQQPSQQPSQQRPKTSGHDAYLDAYGGYGS
tara:strand:- start:1604 stop:2413 length:810 start_codon:yes stop_codon:yes gene_type:complete